MRKISEEAAMAFLNNNPFRRDNTECKNGLMLLHGNTIAMNVEPGKILLKDAGWQTTTTKERLNAILDLLGKSRISQKKGVWYIGGKEWKKYEWNVI